MTRQRSGHLLDPSVILFILKASRSTLLLDQALIGAQSAAISFLCALEHFGPGLVKILGYFKFHSSLFVLVTSCLCSPDEHRVCLLNIQLPSAGGRAEPQLGVPVLGHSNTPLWRFGIAPISPRSSQQQWKHLLSLLQGGAFPQEQEKRRGCRQLPAELLPLTADLALQCHSGSATGTSCLGSLCPLEGADPCSIVPGGPEMLGWGRWSFGASNPRGGDVVGAEQLVVTPRPCLGWAAGDSPAPKAGCVGQRAPPQVSTCVLGIKQQKPKGA